MPQGRNLVVVESPAKARTIHKFLGSDFVVRASMGHVRDLPKSRLGVDLENNFEPQYCVIRGRSRLLKELKGLAKRADRIFLATDPDREGEAIGWHLASELKLKGSQVRRVRFHEITEGSVRDALESPKDLDMNLVHAQQARRVVDRLVGYSLSPVLWKHVARGLSAGRVQSVVLRLVVEREQEIQAFQAREFWNLGVILGAHGGEFPAKLAALAGVKAEDLDQATAQRLAGCMAGASYSVSKVDKRRQTRRPQPPFITSTLQQDAARKLHFSAKKTMLVAQQLYEGLEIGDQGAVGLITYMRTDSVRVAATAQAEARLFIKKSFGEEFLPGSPNTYRLKHPGQDAHEAIRPSSVNREPKQLAAALNPDQLKLYRLIWTRFLASQMAPALFDQTSAEIEAQGPGLPGGADFRAHGSALEFPGFLAAWGKDAEPLEELQDLPALSRSQRLKFVSSEASQHFTQAPPRFNDASLVKELEELGIGRPSTYAPILGTILGRGYVERIEGGRYKPTALGQRVIGLLVEHFQAVLNVRFTAGMEKQLDQVAMGKLGWREAVGSFYAPFSESLARVKALKAAPKAAAPKAEASAGSCEICGKRLVVKNGRFGRFIGCSGYPRCKNTRPMKAAGKKK